MKPRRLKLGTHMDNGWMYRVYRNQAAAAAYLSLYFIFLSLQLSETLSIFVTFFSGTVRPRKLKLGIPVDNGWMYRVYRNQAAALICPIYFFHFFLFIFQTLNVFVTLFSRTVRPRRLKLGTHGDRGRSIVYTGISCWCLFVPLFLPFSFSPIFEH